MQIQADFRQIVHALSDALDLVGVDDVAHGKRVGVMAAECGKALGLPNAEVQFLYDLGLLHDIGVSNTATHQHLVSEFDWAGSQEHTIVGFELLRDFDPLARMALPIRFHHTRWDALQPLDLPPEVVRQANLILLVDRVDALTAPYYASGTMLQHRRAICAEIEQRSGSYFDPALVQVFLQVSAHEAFWLNLEPHALQAYAHAMLAQSQPQPTQTRDLLRLAQIFARIVDAKSAFTYSHSQGVARVARRLGEQLGLSPDRCDQIEIAGLLHDLGKLRVPDAILEKAGPLDTDERLVMNTHSFETQQILRKIDGFEDISAWAADHHEAPGGTGYPYGLDGAQLPLEARILRVADIFQAMVQDRPYRKGLNEAEVGDFMRRLQAEGQVDHDATEVLLQQLGPMVQAARLQR